MGLCSLHHLLLSLFMTFSCSFKVQRSITLCKLKIAFVYTRKKSGKQWENSGYLILQIGTQQLKQKGGVFLNECYWKKGWDTWAWSNFLVTLFLWGFIDSIWLIPISLLFNLYFLGHLILIKPSGWSERAHFLVGTVWQWMGKMLVGFSSFVFYAWTVTQIVSFFFFS